MDKPWLVKTPFGTVWIVRFKTAEAAWRRVVRPAKRSSESEEACKQRMIALGWKVLCEEES